MNKFLKIFSIFLLATSLCLITSCKNRDDGDDDDDKNPTTYTVTYDTQEGTFLNGNTTLTNTYNENAKVDLLTETPIREGYNFLGWYNSETDEQVSNYFFITKNMNLVAKWATITYTITYKTMGGKYSDGETLRVVNVEPNALFTIGEVPINDSGRLFNGWYDSETNEYVEEGFIITKDLVVTAKYSRPGELRTITYVLNGGTQNTPVNDSYYEGIRYTLSVPTKEGFEFLGWYQEADFTGDKVTTQDTTVEGDQTYYASWQLVDENYIDALIDEIVPSELDHDISLPTEYQGVKLYWTSSDYSLLTAKGIIDQTHRNETVTLKCQVTFNNQFYDITRDVVIKAIQFEEVANPVAGYFYNTSVRNKTETFLENFDIVYCAFAYISANGSVSMNNSMSGCTSLLSEVQELRKKGIRCVISIAGGAANFSAGCYSNMGKVVTDIVNLVKTYNLDGVDIDWEYPNNSTDTSNFTLLVKQLRQRLDAMADGNGSPYLVTAAIPANNAYVNFDFEDINEVLDYVNMMSYDMNLDGRTTHLCPLFKGGDGGLFNIEEGIAKFVKAGLDKNKIIIGAAFYGKSYTVTGTVLQDAVCPGLNVAGTLTSLQYSSGTVTYQFIHDYILTDSSYERYWDNKAKVPYLYSAQKNIFITYEDEESLIAKVEYAYQEGLGIMFWEYGYDKNNILTDSICNRMYELRNNITSE